MLLHTEEAMFLFCTAKSLALKPKLGEFVLRFC